MGNMKNINEEEKEKKMMEMEEVTNILRRGKIKKNILYIYISVLHATCYLVVLLPHYKFRPYTAIIMRCLSC
jgi:hypothetical protein